MGCLCVDQEANPRGFEELEKLLGDTKVESLLVLPWGKQEDETPFLYLGGERVLETEARSHALAWVNGLIERLKQGSQKPVVEIKCRYYDCIESRLGDEILSFSRSTNRDYWIVMVERGRDGRLPLPSFLHIQFHGQSPDFEFEEVLATIIGRQLEMQLEKEAKPQ